MSTYFNAKVAEYISGQSPDTWEWKDCIWYLLKCKAEPPTGELPTGADFWTTISQYVEDTYLLGTPVWKRQSIPDLSICFPAEQCPNLQILNYTQQKDYEFRLQIPSLGADGYFGGNYGAGTGSTKTYPEMEYYSVNFGQRLGYVSGLMENFLGVANLYSNGTSGIGVYRCILTNSDVFDEQLKTWVLQVVIDKGTITSARIYSAGRGYPGGNKKLATILQGVKPDGYITGTIITPDPYKPGGTTEPGGGEGDFDNTSDPVDVPATLPPLSASSTGFMTLYNPTLEQVQALAYYMWDNSNISIWDAWMRTMANPSEAILGLSIVPVKVPAGESRVVKIGNISTGVSMPIVTSQYVTVDCGTLNVNEYWGAYLDYDPYTKAEIYLPYIGTRPLSVDDIMGKAVHVIYHIDIVSGACVAFIKCNDSVLYNFVGSCSCPVPTTNYDMSNIFSGTLSIATAVGSILATNGASAPLAVPAVASTAVNNLKPNIAKSGAMGSMGGMLAIQKPYLILTRPRQALPEEQNKYTGYPAYMTLSLSDCTGYTEIESIHLESVLATGTELAEIESLLKGGVIF